MNFTLYLLMNDQPTTTVSYPVQRHRRQNALCLTYMPNEWRWS